MPAKRVIILDRAGPGLQAFRAALWADVPAGNQIAYANPSATSEYDNATPAELQAIRDGAVAEKVIQWSPPSGALAWNAACQAALQAEWTAWQAEVTASAAWNDYGRFWDGSAWQNTTGVPLCGLKDTTEGLPAFAALTPVSAFGASKLHLVLYNGASATTSQGLLARIRLVVILPGLAAVTGAASSPWNLSRRNAPTTNPSGTGGVTVGLFDSAQALPAGIGVWNAPQTAPAGGSLTTFLEFLPQPDEQKVSTADAPTLAALYSGWGGQVVYRAADVWPARPLTIRPGQTLEVGQGATAGTGNCRVLCIFTVG